MEYIREKVEELKKENAKLRAENLKLKELLIAYRTKEANENISRKADEEWER